jgi:ABC-2 type transport system permease protein
MFTIVWRSIKDRKISLIIYMASAILFMWMYVALFPSIAAQAETFTALMDSFPVEVFAIIGVEEMNLSSLENFLSMEHFSLVLPFMMIFLLVPVAGRAIAGEIELGTVELLIGRPLSRSKLYLSKYVSGIGILATFTVFSVFSVIPFAGLHGVEYSLPGIAAGAVIIFLLGWAVFSMSMMFSSFFSNKSKVYMASGGVLLGMYVLNAIALINENLGTLKYFSFFHYYAYSEALIRQSLYGTGCLVFLGVSIISSAVGLWWFQKRDIAV